jgi:hypothetical protein
LGIVLQKKQMKSKWKIEYRVCNEIQMMYAQIKELKMNKNQEFLETENGHIVPLQDIVAINGINL